MSWERLTLTPLYKALHNEACDNIFELIKLDGDDLSGLSYSIQGERDPKFLRRGDINLVLYFNQYYAMRMRSDNPITDDKWTTITKEEFQAYRLTAPAHASEPLPSPSGTIPRTKVTAADNFRRGIKRDPSLFPTLKDEKFNDSWHRSFLNQARAQGIDKVLQKSYQPSSDEERELFDEMQKYLYAVLETCVLTDQGKTIVRSYQDTYNAQRAYAELVEHHLHSTKASMGASDLLTYITSARLGNGTWTGTSEAFILHWQNQVRLYERLVPAADHFSDTQKRHMLENAVHPIAPLRHVKTTAALHTTRTGRSLRYSEYCTLLLSAATQHDKDSAGTSRSKRQVLMHHTIDDPIDTWVPFDPDPLDNTSDTPPVQAFATQAAPSGHPPPDPNTRVPAEQWS